MDYFYLNFKTKTSEFCKYPQESFINLGTLKWKTNDFQHNIQICLSEEFKNINSQQIDLPFNNHFNKYHLHILRSQLQKSVRRQKKFISLKTCLTMALIEDESKQKFKQIGLFEMLRRITIIIIEDSVLIFEYNILVWFLCALSKGFYLNKYFLKWILEILWKVFSSLFKDTFFKFYKLENLSKKKLINDINEDYLLREHKDLLLSIQLRTSFFGMKGDITMIDKSTLIWCERIKNDSYHKNYLKIDYIDYPVKLECLSKTEIELESLDFHCTNIINKIIEYFPMDKILLKKLIWKYSSSLNYKIDITTKLNFIKSNLKQKKVLEWSLIENIVYIEQMKIKQELIINEKF
ncbi:Hypothetical protein KVN_LOCUS341 [uncultured virus]|nr:Hypothetical protein KVN_LOCUS341 [uncultured virus]